MYPTTSDLTSSVKSVNFSPNVSTTYISTAGKWYTKEEFSNLRQDLRNTVERMIEHPDECSDDEDFCNLGLKTPEEFDYDRGARYYAFQSVMAEQDTQLREENYDPDQIAEAYTYITCLQQAVAEKRAAALAAELHPSGSSKLTSALSATPVLQTLQEWGCGLRQASE
ncbi:unnamed protein product [Cylindrotheca closterium]|uniref:Uncharacterized protein n=1 Tax=Cylindrotheca closterium TaxID=2856 RepID=A0AAD2FWG6_9STRA|nr:unnamed protein product [Cylindrotheca closterium]